MSSARELSARLAALLADEHSALADFLTALAEFDHTRAWSELGYTSLFVFLHRELRLSKGAAQYRKTAAELLQRVPEIVEPLRDGRLCLSVVVELARVLTPENQREVLPRFFRLSRQEAMEVVAELSPRPSPPLRQVTTAVRASSPEMPFVIAAAARPRPQATEATREAMPAETVTHVPWSDRLPDPRGRLADLPDAKSPAESSGSLPQPRPERPVVEPVTAELRRLHITVPRRLLEKLAAARDALSHSMPNATDDEILEAGLDLLLAEHAKRKGLVEKPRKAPPPSKSGAVPAHVRRAVWLRAGGRCECRLASGEVCGSTYKLELDHYPIPKARGGPATIENTRLACRRHNIGGARELFGNAVMDRYTREASGPP
jgi:hypothetical protein